MIARSPTRFETAFLALISVLALTSWSAVLLAQLGRLTPGLVVAIALASGSLVTAALTRTWLRTGPAGPLNGAAPGALQAAAAIIVIAVCAAVFFPPYETFIWGSDSTVYLGLGAEIARNNGYELDDPLLAEMSVSTRAEVFRNPVARDAGGTYVRLPGGFTIPDIEEPVVVAGFSPVFPAILAVVTDLGGARAMPWIAPAFATLSMLALFFAGLRTGGVVAGLGAVALAAVSLPQLWFARFPMPEIVAELFVVSALLALAIALATDEPLPAALAGGFLGIAALGKFELLAIATITQTAYIGGRLLWTGRWPTRAYLWMTGSFALIVVHAALHYLMLPSHYALFLRREISSSYAGRAIEALGWRPVVVLAVSIAIALVILLSRGGGIRANLANPRFWGAGATLTVAAYFLRDAGASARLTNAAGLRAGLAQTLAWLQWYLPWPVAATLAAMTTAAAAGAWLRRRRPNSGASAAAQKPDQALRSRAPSGRDEGANAVPTLETLAFTAVLVLVACLHLYRSPDTNEHIWTTRRFVPVVIPGLALLTATMTVMVLRQLSGRRGVLAAGIVLVALTAIVANPSTAVIGQPLWQGSFEAAGDLAQLLPPDSVVLMSVDLAGTHLATTLNYVHAARTIVLPSAIPTPTLLGELIGSWLQRGRPVFLITGDEGTSFYAPRLSLVEVDRRALSVPILERTYDRPPRRIIREQVPLTISRLGPRPQPRSTIDIGNAAEDTFFHIFGFHGSETDPRAADATFRWTTGTARMWIPPVSAVRLTLAGARPAGLPPARLSVSVDGALLLSNVEIADAPAEILLELPADADSSPPASERSVTAPGPQPPRLLVVTSTTFHPHQVSESTDVRQLGVKLYRVDLVRGAGSEPADAAARN